MMGRHNKDGYSNKVLTYYEIMNRFLLYWQSQLIHCFIHPTIIETLVPYLIQI